MQAEGLCQREIPFTLLGIEADMTLFLVFLTQCHNPEEQNPLPKRQHFYQIQLIYTYQHTPTEGSTYTLIYLPVTSDK